jgi:carbonic anhydrase
MEFRVLFVNIIISILFDKSHGVLWNYGKVGPDVWSKIFEECGGHSQSPVNIQTACTIHQKFEPFHFGSKYNDKLNFTLQNDGHTVTAKFNDSELLLNGGNLNGNYQFVNFHLHWGPNENEGSEHQV